MSSPADIFAHASRYPYDPPGFGYRFRHDAEAPVRAEISRITSRAGEAGVAPLVDVAVTVEGGGELCYENRVAVVAAGSNASFGRLKSKFAASAVAADFPVVRAAVRDLVPVYSAHVSIYGAIPGTLTGEAGATSLLHIAFVDARELRELNRSEGIGINYALALIEGLEADFGAGGRLSAALAYVSRRGAFAPDGAPVRLSAFSSPGSRHRALSQAQMLARAQRYLGDGATAEAFVHGHVADAEIRAARIAAMGFAAQRGAIAGLGCIAGGLDAPPARLPDGFETAIG